LKWHEVLIKDNFDLQDPPPALRGQDRARLIYSRSTCDW